MFDACLNGKYFIISEILHHFFDSEVHDNGIKRTIAFWNKVIELEKFLDVEFIPELPISKEDSIWFGRLHRSLIEGKPYKEYIQLNSFTLHGTQLERLLVFAYNAQRRVNR